MEIKSIICSAVGVIGAFIASIFGGWNAALSTLCIFMVIDYVTGMVVAGVFHASPKTASGSLESRAGIKGLFRKCMIFLYVFVAHRLDIAIGTTYVKDLVCIGFICNEVLSITENAGLMGIPIPAPITNAIEILKNKNQADTD